MQCTCRMAGRCARCRVQGGDSSAVLTVTLATPAPAGECSSPAQHRTAGSLLHLQDYVHNNVIIIIDWALPAIRKPVLELVCTGWLCCPWSEFSDILHDGVQALWYMVHAPSLHWTHTRPTGGPHIHQTKVKADKLTEILTKCTFRKNNSYHYNDMM